MFLAFWLRFVGVVFCWHSDFVVFCILNCVAILILLHFNFAFFFVFVFCCVCCFLVSFLFFVFAYVPLLGRAFGDWFSSNKSLRHFGQNGLDIL